VSEELKFGVSLTLDELMMLDKSRVSTETLDAITTAEGANGCRLHYGVTQREGLFLQHIRELAVSQKMIRPIPCRIDNCRLCGKGPNIVLFQSGRNKGREKARHGNPGYEFKDNCITIRGLPSVGCCADCFTRLLPHIAEQVSDVEAEVSEKITGHAPRFKRHRDRKCTKCGWVGHEGQMGKLRTMMGDGWYPGVCPECKAENLFLTTVVETLPTYSVVPVAHQPQVPA
jgi:hypothetical protein